MGEGGNIDESVVVNKRSGDGSQRRVFKWDYRELGGEGGSGRQ